MWLAHSGILKKLSPPPLSRLWRNCPGRSSNLKTICPILHLYGPVSQPLGVSAFLLQREDIEGSHHRARRFYLQGGSPRKNAAPVFRKNLSDDVPISSEPFPRQSRKADLTLDCNEEILDSHLQEVRNRYYDQD